MPIEPLLRVEHLVKNFGALRVTDDVSLEVVPGQLHAIIGPNGAGKTSLINQISGDMASHAGRIVFDGADVTSLNAQKRARAGLLRSFQITSVFDQFSVLENATVAALGTRGHAFGFWKPLMQRADLLEAAWSALRDTGIDGKAHVPVESLGYGERRQLELAMALASMPKLLLLDEPMAGMSPQECGVVVELLQRLKQRYGVLLVEHDMDAVFALADVISVMVDGRVIFRGPPAAVRDDPEVRGVYLGDGETFELSGGRR